MQVKHVEDYYDKILEEFPDLSRSDLDKLLKHAMRSMYQLIVSGADVILNKPGQFTMFFGKLFFDRDKTAKYYNLKYKAKYRIK